MTPFGEVVIIEAVELCPNCGDPLDPEYENGFTCDDCTRSQPMDVWVSSWPKVLEDF